MSELKPAKQITPQSWMRSPETRAVMAALNEGHEKPQALFVGGCVRNALLGEAVEDIDIATLWTPDQAQEKLAAAGIKTIPTGIEHGTITAVTNGRAYEITTLRKDVETDGRRAVIAFSDNWAEDSQRRDFTINTLLADEKGIIYDPTGQGLNDINAKRIVFVGEAAQRIEEDLLRILRFFRFHSLYASGAPDQKALESCRAAAHKIPELSKERITQEFMKILAADNPADILAIMFENGILKDFDFGTLQDFKYLCEFQNRYGLGFVASRLFMLAGLDLANIGKMEALLLLPKVFKKDMQAIDQVLKLPDISDDQALKTAIYKHGRVPTAQALMIELVQDRVMNGAAPAALKIIQNWDIPTFPVSGDDLIKQGFKPGPDLGRELERLEEDWIAGGFR